MGDWKIEGDYWRDGAVCVRDAFDDLFVDLARDAIEANLAELSPYAKRASDRRRGVRRGLLQLGADRADAPVHRRVAAAIAAELMGRDGAPLPRPRPGQGAGTPSAPRGTRTCRTTTSTAGSTRRCGSRSTRCPGVDARVRRGRTGSGHAALVPRRRGSGSPAARSPSCPIDERGRFRHRLGTRARRRVLSTCDAAGRRRRQARRRRGCCRCASWATTWSTPPGAWTRHRRPPGSRTS